MTLEQLINGYLREEQERRKDRVRSQKFNPSLFGRCQRAQIWNRRNEPITDAPDDRALRIFRVGHLFHEFVQQFIPDHEKEVKCETDDVLGFADIVTKDCVIDLKSVNSRAFWHMAKETYNIAEAKFNNWLQAGFYAMYLKKEYCSLCFISKDDLCIKQYHMPTSKWVGEVDKELAELRRFWSVGGFPPPIPRAYKNKGVSQENRYCQFRSKCKECK